MQFRKDINGLRAIAVIAVVLFHFNASWMPGGFAGVDVFFVISGFLMTGIIFRGIEQENFSILKFYVARANRIIPALALLCLVLLIFGWFYLTPLDYKALGKHVMSSMVFLSNVVYWSESGYFDAASHEKWLLHTWSLSAEWQFYIIYPLVLVAMRKFMSVKAMKATILAGTLLGFIICVIATYKWPNPSYYLLSARAWEMMIGGVAYLYPIALKKERKKLLEWFGLVLIIVSYFFISKDNPWPGYLAVFPVLGSFLIIQAQRNDSLITSNIVFQKLGAWSYSIYLWHWPIVVAIYYFSLSEIFIYIGITLSVLFGLLSNKYIEKIKFRNDFISIFSYIKCKPIYMMLIVGILGSGVFISNGIQEHYSDDVIVASNEAINTNPYKCMDKFLCEIGNKDNIKAIIIGDSHANAMTTSIAHSFDLKDSGVISLTESGCPFILNAQLVGRGDSCYLKNKNRAKYLNSHHSGVPVFWIARTGVYIYGQSNPKTENDTNIQPLIYFTTPYKKPSELLYKELTENLGITIEMLTVNHPVYILQPVPEMRKNVPKSLALNLMLNKVNNDLSIDSKLYFERNEHVRNIITKVADMNNIQVLDPIPYLCHQERCMAVLEGRPIYSDDNHFSEYGNRLLTPMFKLAIEQL
ncbi:acyltransferase family protein [Pseudocolwellia agarivorans]|uniref:acyltransferase family protein n=1 Tax=Pseudocolwellia agarivorans TaxID=1911682 RepID=UPI00098480E8|nr:acyltransferase family protein [Pseudocolwellia agarivorans]